MKSLVRYLLAGLVSAFAPVSAWASSGPGNMLIAPQLQVATDGPVTATLLGTAPTTTIFGITGAFNFSVLAIAEIPFRGFPFTTYPLLLSVQPATRASTPALPANTKVTLASTFGLINEVPSTIPVSLTGGRSTAEAAFFEPPGSAIDFDLHFNAGVIETGHDRVLIGFTLSSLTPRTFGGFPVRISVSNVCVR